MPTGTTGTPITLNGQFNDADGNPDEPTSPRVSIINPLGEEVINDATPTPTETLGRYDYIYDIPEAGPVGLWKAIWTGVIDGDASEGEESFAVVNPADVVGACDAPMWATIEQFQAYPGNESVSDEDAEEAIIEATWLLSGLVLDRFHGVVCRTDEYRSRRGLCKIELAGSPVDTIFSVHRVDDCTGEATEVEGWCQLSGGYVRICCSPSGSPYLGQQRIGYGLDPAYASIQPCHCDDGVIRVQYRLNDNLPPGTARQVIKLATEFWKSSNGKACSLPERITSISKAGVSWTILDPLDYLDAGRTGIGSIDMWIRRVNGTGVAGLIDPLQRPQLLLSTITGCGPGCTGSA